MRRRREPRRAAAARSMQHAALTPGAADNVHVLAAAMHFEGMRDAAPGAVELEAPALRGILPRRVLRPRRMGCRLSAAGRRGLAGGGCCLCTGAAAGPRGGDLRRRAADVPLVASPLGERAAHALQHQILVLPQILPRASPWVLRVQLCPCKPRLPERKPCPHLHRRRQRRAGVRPPARRRARGRQQATWARGRGGRPAQLQLRQAWLHQSLEQVRPPACRAQHTAAAGCEHARRARRRVDSAARGLGGSQTRGRAGRVRQVPGTITMLSPATTATESVQRQSRRQPLLPPRSGPGRRAGRCCAAEMPLQCRSNPAQGAPGPSIAAIHRAPGRCPSSGPLSKDRHELDVSENPPFVTVRTKIVKTVSERRPDRAGVRADTRAPARARSGGSGPRTGAHAARGDRGTTAGHHMAPQWARQ